MVRAAAVIVAMVPLLSAAVSGVLTRGSLHSRCGVSRRADPTPLRAPRASLDSSVSPGGASCPGDVVGSKTLYHPKLVNARRRPVRRRSRISGSSGLPHEASSPNGPGVHVGSAYELGGAVPAGYSLIGTSPAAHPVMTGLMMRQASSASSPRMNSL